MSVVRKELTVSSKILWNFEEGKSEEAEYEKQFSKTTAGVISFNFHNSPDFANDF